MILQYLYKPVLNFIYEKSTNQISENNRNIIIATCFFILTIIQFLSMYRPMGVFTSSVRDWSFFILVAVITVVSVDRKLETIKFNLVIYIPYALMAVFILIASLHHDLGKSFMIMPIVMLVSFLCLFYVWGNRKDYDVLFTSFARAYMVFTIGVIIVSILFCPYFKDQLVHLYGYSIMGINPNGFAKLLLPSIVSGVYLLISSKYKIEMIISAIIVGAAGYLLVITQSRAGMLGLILLSIVGIIYLRRNNIKEKCNNTINLKSLTIIIIIAVITMAGLLQYFSPLINEPLKNPVEAMETKEEIENVYSSVTKEESDDSYSYVGQIGSEIIADNQFLLKLDTYSAGRISIWSAYLDNITLSGRSENLLVWGPHNQYIEMSYKTGILTGIIWLCLSLLIGGIIVHKCVKTKKEFWLFQLLAFIVFFIISMLDTGTFPTQRSFIFMYFLSLAPLFVKEEI